MDGGAWWAAIYGVAQSRPRLKRLSSSSLKLGFPYGSAIRIRTLNQQHTEAPSDRTSAQGPGLRRDKEGKAILGSCPLEGPGM